MKILSQTLFRKAGKSGFKFYRKVTMVTLNKFII